MQISVQGSTIRRKQLVNNLLLFLNRFNKQYDRNLKIDVMLRRVTDCDGSCQQSGNNTFKLIVDPNLPIRRFIEVVIHEYTHIRQTYSDKCFTDCGGRTTWRGKTYSKNYIDPDRREYWLAPWEIEAVGMQNIMCDYLESRLEIDLSELTWLNCGMFITTLKDMELH